MAATQEGISAVLQAGQIPLRDEERLNQMRERFAALVNLGMPPEYAQGVVQRVAAQQAPAAQAAQISVPAPAPAPQAPGPRPVTVEEAQQRSAIMRNPERARAIASLGSFDPGMNPRNLTIEQIAALQGPAAQQAQSAGMRVQEARDYINRRNAAYALPEYIEVPAQPAVAAPQSQLPAAPVMTGPERKEREEKHQDESNRIAQQAPAPQAPAPRPGLFPPKRLAPIVDEINRAAAMTNASLGEMAPYLQRAERQSALGSQEFPKRRQDYMNPYIQDVVNKIREEGLRTLNEGVLPALEAQFIRRGTHGSSNHADLARKAARDAQSEILSRQANALFSGYGKAGELFGNDQFRKLQHAQDIKGIGALNQASNIADIGNLMNMGQFKQNHAQLGKENDYYEFMRRKNEPMELLERQAAFESRQPPPISQFNVASVPRVDVPNTAATLGSLAGQVLGASMMRRRGGPVRRRAR